jgi:4-hydroxy-tetrahydrodipicolinate synthase
MLPTGALDLPAYSSLLEWHMEQGTDGLCVLGTTGEAATMSMEERREVLEVTQELCQGKIPYMVGCGAIDPNVVVE